MSAIDLMDAAQAPLLVRTFYEDGDPGPMVAALAHVPELCELALPFIGAALGPSAVPFRLKEVAVLRTSARMQCRYCTDAHSVVAVDSGLTLDEVRALRGELDVDEVFSDEAELAMLDWIDALAGTPGPLDPALCRALRTRFADHTIVELTVTVATTILLNRLATGLELPTSHETAVRLVELGLGAAPPAFPDGAGVPVTIGRVLR
jgi:AhpD family alkylhydroperoxidase